MLLLAFSWVAVQTAASVSDPAIGLVERVESHWIGDRIVSDVQLLQDDGARTTFQTLGGSVDGIGMYVADMPTVQEGERVVIWREDAWLSAKVTLLPAPDAVAPNVGSVAGRRAFVRAQTARASAPLAWFDSNCVTMVPDAAGSDDVDDETDMDAIAKSASNWRESTAECGYLDLVIAAAQPNRVAQYDVQGPYQNVIVFLEDYWGRQDEDLPYPASRTALTTLFFIDDPSAADEDGRLLDADIELNGVTWTFSTSSCNPDNLSADIENTLTHEMGHVMGLDHTCDTGAGEPPFDDAGKPLPPCANASVKVAATTMFGFAESCAVFMRTPEADDISAICSVYPLAEDPGECRPPQPVGSHGGGGGCAVAMGYGYRGAATPPLWGFLVLGCALLVRRRPRR